MFMYVNECYVNMCRCLQSAANEPPSSSADQPKKKRARVDPTVESVSSDKVVIVIQSTLKLIYTVFIDFRSCWIVFIHMNLSLNEATDVAQNRPLWRLMSTFGVTHF